MPPLLGLLCDGTSQIWSYTRWAESHKDLQYTSFLYALQTAFFFVLAASIRVSNIWLFLLMPSIGVSFFRCVFFTNVNFCYSINVRGMTIAIGNIMSLAVLWTQQYIVEAVQINQNFDVYLYAQIGLSVFVLVFLLPIPFLRIFKIDPMWLRKLDQVRIDEQKETSIEKWINFLEDKL